MVEGGRSSQVAHRIGQNPATRAGARLVQSAHSTSGAGGKCPLDVARGWKVPTRHTNRRVGTFTRVLGPARRAPPSPRVRAAGRDMERARGEMLGGCVSSLARARPHGGAGRRRTSTGSLGGRPAGRVVSHFGRRLDHHRLRNGVTRPNTAFLEQVFTLVERTPTPVARAPSSGGRHG